MGALSIKAACREHPLIINPEGTKEAQTLSLMSLKSRSEDMTYTETNTGQHTSKGKHIRQRTICLQCDRD